MGTWSRTLSGGQGYHLDFIVEEAVTAGQVMVRTATATDVGEAEDPAATTAADFLGCASHAVTYDATPAAEPIAFGHTPENLARIIVNPDSVWRFAISGGTASGTALQPATATPANILSNDTQDTTPDLITETAVGTINMAGGLVKGRTGSNVGAIRKLNAHTNSTSTGVGIDFINTMEVGDTFIRVPYSRMVAAMQLTTDWEEANGIIATGTGAAFGTVNVIIDEENDLAWVDVVSLDHFYNPA